MNNIEQMLEKSSNIQQFAQQYFNYLFKFLNNLPIEAIEAFTEEMERARKNDNTIFLIGNGGSAATASHMANDFGTDIRKRGGSEIPFRALSLTDNAAVMLAIANDDSYENLFVNQLRIHYRQGDKLVAISASGNSPNVVAAAKWVKTQGGKVLSLVGFDGGKLKEISDVVIHVKSEKGEYGPVEDVHMIMDHLLANWLQYRVLKEQRKAEES